MLQPFLSYSKNAFFTLWAWADLAHLGGFCIFFFCTLLQSAGVIALVLGTS